MLAFRTTGPRRLALLVNRAVGIHVILTMLKYYLLQIYVMVYCSIYSSFTYCLTDLLNCTRESNFRTRVS